VFPQVDPLKQSVDYGFAFAAGNAFQYGEVVEHFEGRDTRVNAKFLGQITQYTAYGVFVFQNINITQSSRAGIGVLKGGKRAHQGAFACAVGAKQPVHAGGYIE
jgi:hypothetical protein